MPRDTPPQASIASPGARLDPSSEQALRVVLQHNFADPALLAAALTHASFVNEHATAGATYERLEFVGDAVLGALCARILYTQRPQAPEGELSRRRARVVRRDTLAQLANDLHLEPHVRVGVGHRKNAAGLGASIMADVLEAVAGALFMDAGIEAVNTVFEGLFSRAIQATEQPQDFKTRLQEAVYPRRLGVPTYKVEATSGPSHALTFHCVVHLGDIFYGRGEGTSKKAAEQICARQALRSLGIGDDVLK